MKNIRPRRSALYLPGSKDRVLEKAKFLAADVLIFDLEDSVVPEVKPAARQAVATALAAGDYGHRELIVRINEIGSPWGIDDLKMALEAGADGILVPKINTVADVDAVKAAMVCQFGADGHKRDVSTSRADLWLMIETPRAVLNIATIAVLSEDHSYRLRGFVMGTNDLALETRADLGEERMALVPWLQTCLIAARGHGLEILDGVFNAIGDVAGFVAECQQGKSLGMDGKTLIHPSQISAANQNFAPSEEDVAWSKRVLAAFAKPDAQDVAVLQLEGKMVERLHIRIAERVVALSEAIIATR